jgi:hypothetical protein
MTIAANKAGSLFIMLYETLLYMADWGQIADPASARIRIRQLEDGEIPSPPVGAVCDRPFFL